MVILPHGPPYMEGSISLPVLPSLSSPMAALPDVRRQAASCRCAISAPGGPASIGSSLRGIGDGGRKLQLRPDRRRPRRRASAESSVTPWQ
uniref:Uncharacterized protein n=1 Tax=Oryza glumipatula TaxID=40148 RepID=A0A0E0ASK4_9ORYZ